MQDPQRRRQKCIPEKSVEIIAYCFKWSESSCFQTTFLFAYQILISNDKNLINLLLLSYNHAPPMGEILWSVFLFAKTRKDVEDFYFVSYNKNR